MQKYVTFVEKAILQKLAKNKHYRKVIYHCHCTGKYGDAAHNSCSLKFNVPNEIPAVFHNGSNYDYNFIIKELANTFAWKLECFGENTEKYKTFSVPIENKVITFDKVGKKSVAITK